MATTEKLEKIRKSLDKSTSMIDKRSMTKEQFKAKRLALGLKQKELAIIMGFSVEHVCRMENGQKSISKVVELALRSVKVKVKQQ